LRSFNIVLPRPPSWFYWAADATGGGSREGRRREREDSGRKKGEGEGSWNRATDWLAPVKRGRSSADVENSVDKNVLLTVIN